MDLKIEKNFPLGPLTWYGVGGVAEAFARPKTVQQLSLLVRRCHDCGTAVHVIGKGANLLIADGVVPGLVIQLSEPIFRRIERNGERIRAGAGANLAKVIMFAVREGLGGLEGLAGIPASVGGAVRMNAGGRYGEIGPQIERITCMDATGQIIEHHRGELHFEYRHAQITEPLILDATFALREDDSAELRVRVKDIFDYKKSTQPMGAKSVGCTFKNPPSDQSERPAGWLIDQAGLKGLRIGGAVVSPHHANFIVTEPGATATDVLAVVEHVEQAVSERFGVQLQREVVIWTTT